MRLWEVKNHKIYLIRVFSESRNHSDMTKFSQNSKDIPRSLQPKKKDIKFNKDQIKHDIIDC